MLAERTAAPAAVLMGLIGATLAAAGEQPPPAVAREPLPPPGITIDHGLDGGRDPFVRPVAMEVSGPAPDRPAGRLGLAVREAVLRGVVATREGRLAVLEAPDARTYVVRRGDRLHDGRVEEIVADAVAFRLDPAGLEPSAERTIRRRLRDTESAR